jgi:YesN/AraC family two-component response regulator
MYKVMIVEDEPMERLVLRKIITKGFADRIILLDDAKNGIEAVSMARELKPDIIIMDIGLPGKPGIAVQEEILSFLPNVQTVIQTAYSDFVYVQKALSLGAKDYLLKPVKADMLECALNRILTSLQKNVAAQQPYDVRDLDLEKDVIKKAIVYMNNHFTDKVDLNAIAKHVHMNAKYISRIFKKETGINCVDYLNQLRINYACKMLSTTAYPIYRVAMDSGFSDASYFNKVFTKVMKETPLGYRKKHTHSSMSSSSFGSYKMPVPQGTFSYTSTIQI